jgi:hypothetical protein
MMSAQVGSLVGEHCRELAVVKGGDGSRCQDHITG